MKVNRKPNLNTKTLDFHQKNQKKKIEYQMPSHISMFCIERFL